MNPARWQQIKNAFDEALQLDPSRRAHYLDKISASDREVGREVESLLAAHEQVSAAFLNIPAAGLEAFQELIGPDPWVGRHIGPYLLVRELGAGGMGEVYLATRADAEFEQQVAIKLIRTGQESPFVVGRFKTERQILASLDHPNIAKLLDGGRTPQGQPYFVMEYVPGLPITAYCDRGKLRIRERLELFIHACDGVQYAHQNAIIHRDLKPANILIVEVDGRPVPRIIDFGLAKATTPTPADQTLLTRFGHFMGTPGYMSPEQADPTVRVINTRTDVYSLGVILYVLLTGLLPFETKRHDNPLLDEFLRQLREQEPPPPSGKVNANRETSMAVAAARGVLPKQLVSLLRGDLDVIALRALARERERRYGTPAELIADLQRYLNHEPVVARSASAAYQLGKFMRRHRVAAIVAGTVAILAIVTSGAGLLAIRKQHEAQYQATQALRAQSRLLTQAAIERLKDHDVAGAQGIILEVLTNPEFAQEHPSAAISVFQEIRAADRQLAVLSGHGDLVRSAAYSPDGTRIVTASYDKTVGIWDARTGVQLAVLSGHGDLVHSAAYSPDGARIVTASYDRTARIWDARSGAQLAVLSGHSDFVNSAAYSPDGARIVTASQDKTARIWDARSGAQLAVLLGHGDQVRSAAYSPDGTRIVTASADKTARIWDARSGAQLAVLSGHGNFVESVAYSPDGKRVVTAAQDKTARIWDSRTGAQLAVLSGHSEFVNSAAYSPDGNQVVTASYDRTARIWDAHTGAQLAVLSGHGNFVESAAYSPDGSRIVTGSYDKTARIWDARMGAQITVLSGHGNRVTSAAYSPDGTRIATASYDNTARIWDARTGTQLAVLSGHDARVYCAAYSPDGTQVVTASQDKTARIWDARTGAQLTMLSGHGNFVDSAAYSPDGNQVVTASYDKTARIWDARTGAQLAVLSGHGNFVNSAAFSPDGARIVTASADNTARFWDARTAVQLSAISEDGDYIDYAAYSPDGARIVTTSTDKTARVRDARTGAQLAVLSGHGNAVASAAYSPDGTRIVTASADNTARIWDARTGVQLAVLSGHDDQVRFAAYSPDGARIVTASADKTARIWDARVPAAIRAQIRWAASAQADPLSSVDRAQLGLPPDSRARSWSTMGSDCDRAAAAFYDPDRLAPGALQRHIDAVVANSACSREVAKPEHVPRSDYQMGRALLAEHDVKGAEHQFELAASRDYRAARIDLANLLQGNSAGIVDLPRAVALYEKAWRDGVSIAAFELGQLYEKGVATSEPAARATLQPGLAKAWSWYRKGADMGEPHALARFAERDERKAAAEEDPAKRNALLLQACGFYAAAAERASDEGWPDDVWSNWRYRRATLSRLLAREGMMQQVADAYTRVRDTWTPRSPSWWDSLGAKLHLSVANR